MIFLGQSTMRKRIFTVVAAIAGIVVLVLLGVALWIRGQLAGSLPQLDGEIRVAALGGEVVVERDSLGVPTIRAGNRVDLAFATGFVHAQDRFFQMDLLRRNSAGELAEVVGPAVLEKDRKVRRHRFRDAAERMLAAGSDADRELVAAYAAGVNAGLASLRVIPFEYLLLGQQPAPWKPEDSALVMFSMYLDLQGDQFSKETRWGLMKEVLGDTMYEFLAPRGSEWDAPIDGEAFDVPPIPGPEVFDTRNQDLVTLERLAPVNGLPNEGAFHPGSNNWAVAGSQSADGRAILANDMHLDIRVPHIWYRASFVWPRGDDGPDSQAEQRMTGVTLPGTPAMVVGSNGHVAWGFTNTEGDWADVVLVDRDPDNLRVYQTPDGPRHFEHDLEIIKVHGQEDELLDVVSTIWGPVIDYDHQDRARVLRWVAHDTEGVNLGLIRIESAKTLEDAMLLANLSGSPAQNFMVVDDQGRIAWTVLGRIPRRAAFDSQVPGSWADGSRRWDGYLNSEDYPRVFNPERGKLWTANGRVVSGEMLATMGDGGYDLGARARQIRDDLLATEKATEADMLRIQLDDRAVFLERWQKLLLDTLSEDAVEGNPKREKLRGHVADWGGRASVDSVGFRAVRTFRHKLLAQLSDVLVSPCKQYDKTFKIWNIDRTEGPVWRLVSERPEHMIDPRFETWDALLLAAADQVIADAGASEASLASYRWGGHNTTRIQHPLSQAVPMLAGWLDMQGRPLDGDSENMPRIQAPETGASQRMGVSPGHESDGYLHMPCGQSGHPLSPHYRDCHRDWEEGKPTPFLPGPAVHTLVLKPAG
jgi:penicillin amidase